MEEFKLYEGDVIKFKKPFGDDTQEQTVIRSFGGTTVMLTPAKGSWTTGYLESRVEVIRRNSEAQALLQANVDFEREWHEL